MDAVALLVITAFVLIVNRGVHMSWLFVDDLYLWNDFNENPGFLGYVFPKHANYFRPVYWLMAWSVLKIAGTNLQMVIYVNLLILIITSFILYSFLRSLLRGVGGGYVLSLLLSVAFSICRFSFYQVSQLVGLVESVALLFVLLMMISLYGYMKEGCTLKFFAGLLCYILAVLTHERYMVLLPMLFYAVIFEGEGSVFGFLNAKG
ncbi:MAG: glycosyltransferase family 39 protein, partial [Eubacteriales bacterium]|nr:glycosyltransferase family 39 protein [Eubacteriales bacterium]